MNPLLKVEDLSIAYGKSVVVDQVSFQLSKGEIACLLGPSGCGKTTLLRAIAGFEPLHRGAIHLNDTLIVDTSTYLAPEKRNIGMVFQDFALFPHLSIAGNIGFGIKHLNRSQQQQRVKYLLKLISLDDFGSRYPHELSGGQQQRVALARALAPKPDLILMDEPFSSIDTELREALAKEVKEILKKEDIAAIVVTHDQNEAFILADNIGVMKAGKLLQWSDDYTLYNNPSNPDVASFIGQGVFIKGTVIKGTVVGSQQIKTAFTTLQIPTERMPKTCSINSEVCVFIRPGGILFDSASTLKATIVERKFQGKDYLYALQLEKQTQLLARADSHHRYELDEQVGITLRGEHCRVFVK